jgi:MYXO-CTERM domain-containing protein
LPVSASLLCLSLFCVSLLGCSRHELQAQSTVPIINGKSCASSEYPSTVAMIYAPTVSQYGQQTEKIVLGCTGTLIAPDVVLTAGHCTEMNKSPSAQRYQIISERYYVSRQADLSALVSSSSGGGYPGYPPPTPPKLPSDAVEVKEWITHPQFRLDALNGNSRGLGQMFDVGLLILSRPITDIQPAVLITQKEASQIVAQASLAIVGYGQTSPERPNPMQPPTGKGVRTCAQSFINEVGPHEIQVGGDRTTSRKCHGDSGGPSYMDVNTTHERKQRLIGVTSRGYDPQLDCYLGGVDSRVDAYLDWIDKELSERCSKGSRPWCTVSGVIPPSFYDTTPPQSDAGSTTPQSDAGVGVGGADAYQWPNNNPPPAKNPPADCPCNCEQSGCSVAATPAPFSLPLMLFVLFGLVAISRRR